MGRAIPGSKRTQSNKNAQTFAPVFCLWEQGQVLWMIWMAEVFGTFLEMPCSWFGLLVSCRQRVKHTQPWLFHWPNQTWFSLFLRLACKQRVKHTQPWLCHWPIKHGSPSFYAWSLSSVVVCGLVLLLHASKGSNMHTALTLPLDQSNMVLSLSMLGLLCGVVLVKPVLGKSMIEMVVVKFPRTWLQYYDPSQICL